MTENPAGTVLDIENLSKTFPGTRALEKVSLSVGKAEIHALVGQNGSGKSTLVKILAGYHRADPGCSAQLNQTPLDLNSAATARHDRLRFVHQDLGLFLELSAIDNLALRGEFVRGPVGLVNWREQATLTRELLDQFGFDLDPKMPLGRASPVQRTIVAIAAALVGWEGGPGVLVLDEPTAVLPPPEVDRLLTIVEQLRNRGTSVLYVSHRLDEIFRIADSVTVLRGGHVVATRSVKGLTTQSLAQLMVGSGVDASYRAEVQYPKDAPVALRAKAVRGSFLRGVGLELREGEVLGLAGLPGSGSIELAYALAGEGPSVTGEVALADGRWTPIRKAASFDIPIVPADRSREAIVGEFSVRENLSLSVLRRFRRFGLLRRDCERTLVGTWLRRTEVKAESPDAPVSSLSGGNQQKVVIARCLARDPRILVLVEPTAGVDVGTRQAIYEFVASRARAGLAVVVTSTDLGDLLAICSRVLVLVDGELSQELTGQQINEHALLHAMEAETQ